MAYADQKQNRTVAIGSVVLVHAALGAALLSGLAVKFAPVPDRPLDTTNIPIEPPPPPDPTPPEPLATTVQPREAPTPPLHAPKAVVPTPNTIDLTTTPFVAPPLPPLRIDPPLPSAEPPVSVILSRAVQPRGDQGSWFPQDSYPAAARRAGAEGRVSVSVEVGTNGRVTACRVTASSGNQDLDQATCRLATRNGRFTPALNEAGEPVAATVPLRNVRWKLEE